jgi:predicted acylesterase/phospholipase RssA
MGPDSSDDDDLARSARQGNVRVVYLGHADVVGALTAELACAGARPEETPSGACLTIPTALVRRLLPAETRDSTVARWPGAQVFFHTRAFEVAALLPRLDADLVIVDERVDLPPRPPRGNERRARLSARGETNDAPAASAPPIEEAPQGNTPPDVLVTAARTLAREGGGGQGPTPPVTFEELHSTLAKFTPRGFHFPTRRIVVVLPEGGDTAQRTFQLGIANVRRVIIAPPTSAELFAFATRQVADFRAAHAKTALCISGGGLEGYIYAVGVSQALEDCFENRTNNDFDIYCGVSSGAILALTLASGMSTEDVVGQLYKRKGKLEPLQLSTIFDFAGGEIVKRLLDLLRGVSSLDPSEAVARLQRVIPVGFFKGERLKAFIEQQLKRSGLADNLTAIPKELYISATDQDTGEHVVFGEEPWRDVRASAAVRASTALPPFYLPERINGHWFSDGQLTSSSDFNTAIRKGARLVVLIDPMVAYTSSEPGAVMKHGGYFTAVQAIKSLVQTRAQSFLRHSMDVHPDVDFVVFRPTDEVMEAMAGNPMRYRIRTELAELGYKGTLVQMLAQYESLSHRFGKHGFGIKSEAEISALLERR